MKNCQSDPQQAVRESSSIYDNSATVSVELTLRLGKNYK